MEIAYQSTYIRQNLYWFYVHLQIATVFMDYVFLCYVQYSLGRKPLWLMLQLAMKMISHQGYSWWSSVPSFAAAFYVQDSAISQLITSCQGNKIKYYYSNIQTNKHTTSLKYILLLFNSYLFIFVWSTLWGPPIAQ